MCATQLSGIGWRRFKQAHPVSTPPSEALGVQRALPKHLKVFQVKELQGFIDREG